VGSYQPFTITLPPGVGFADDAELARYATVNVIDPNTVDLRTFDRRFNGTIDLFWLMEPAEPTVWMKTDTGEFELAPEGVSTFEISSSTNTLTIYELSLSSGSVYTFQVRYENGGVSVNNFVIDLTGTRPVYSAIRGDRDGGDRGPVTSPRPPLHDDTDDEGAQTDDTDAGDVSDDDATKDDATKADATKADLQNDTTAGSVSADITDNPSNAAQPQPAVLRPAPSATQQAPYDILPIPRQPENNRPEVLANPAEEDAAIHNPATAPEARITDTDTPLTAKHQDPAATSQSLPLLMIAGVLGVIAFAGITYLVVKKTVRNRLK
jgi:hypothetical protein